MGEALSVGSLLMGNISHTNEYMHTVVQSCYTHSWHRSKGSSDSIAGPVCYIPTQTQTFSIG